MSRFFLQPRGVDAGLQFGLHEGLNTVGRNPTNDIRLTEASVSSFHCELEVSSESIVVRDLQSTNGTRVNGAVIDESRLLPGDELRLGQLSLMLNREVPIVTIPKLESAPATPGRAPLYRCTRCQKVWETRHVKHLKVGRHSDELYFCPACSGRCSLVDPAQSQGLPLSEPSLLSRLTQTIQIGVRRRE